MSERNGFEPGAPCWIVAIEPDPPEAARFYAELFGWETEDGAGDYIRCLLRGRAVAGIAPIRGTAAPPQPTWVTNVWVDSAADAASRAAEAGGRVIVEAFERPGGGHSAVLADPSGAVLCAWEPGSERGAELVNEPSAWSMSALVGADPAEVSGFYNEVFGWEAEPMEGGGATLFRLPGFHGGEPSQPVPRDVVAVIVPANQGGEGETPYWNVDFWVDGAESTAARAAELGGTVVAEPYDVGPFKQAVIADPNGAAFTISELVMAPSPG
jgi:predicted enzyme related to lactoylglutathione lyase